MKTAFKILFALWFSIAIVMGIFILVLLCGCASEPHRFFNIEDSSQPKCAHLYGGRPGYCRI